MARDIFVNGNTMVTADGAELGIGENSVTISLTYKHLDVMVSTFGGSQGVPHEVQAMLAEASISMVLANVDPGVLDTVIRKSMASSSIGVMPIAGTLMGGNSFFTSLRISSPVAGRPWTFPTTYLADNPISWPLGNERSLVSLTFRAIPYQADPSSAGGAVLFTRA